MPRRRKGLTDEAIEQAKMALANFRAMQPMLTSYAQMLTGNPKARVVADKTSNGSTDGVLIYYRPPISLGKVLTHYTYLCDRRDSRGIMKCEACAQREAVLVTIYHEIAHIWFGSFPGITPADKALAIRAAIIELGTKYGNAIKSRIAMHGSKVNFMTLAGVVSPFLPILLNCLEDARVNRALFKALPGVEMMFDADTACIFDQGVEGAQEDGTWGKTLWKDQPLNHQATIGVFCMASGYNFEDWLNPFVVKNLNDDQLKALIGRVVAAGTAREIFHLSFPILARLRELGYCRSSADPEDDDWTPPFKEPEDEQPPALPAPSAGTDNDDDEAEAEDGDKSEPDDADSDSGESDEQSGDSGDDSAEQEAGSSGGDSEGDTGEGESEPGDEDDVDEESDGDSGAGQGAARSSETDDSADGESTGGDDDAGDSSSDTGEAGKSEDEVPASDGAGDAAGDVPAGEPADSDGDFDGHGTGGDDLERLPSEDPGLSGDDESRGLGDDTDDGDDGHPADADVDSDDVEPIDTGDWTSGGMDDSADDRPVRPDLPWGEAIDVIQVLADMGGHEVPHSHGEDDSEPGHVHHSHDDEHGDEIITAVLATEMYFERPSKEVTGVEIHVEGSSDVFKEPYAGAWKSRRRIGAAGDFDPPESILGPALLRARVIFADNSRGRNEIGLRQGRVHSPSIGRKAPVGEGDFFRKRRLPGHQSYFVGIGVDVSGSTLGTKIDLAKQVAMAEAELLNRLGIPFFLYCHTGGIDWNEMKLDMIEIKNADEPWNDKTRERLRVQRPQACNLDGHTIQLYRKMLEKRREQTKILHYYSDGAMPLENYDEELVILKKEIQLYKRLGIVLAGVGIRTDSPKEHGLPTVIVESQTDVIKVVEDLEQWLTRR